jgi:hypothetical protein
MAPSGRYPVPVTVKRRSWRPGASFFCRGRDDVILGQPALAAFGDEQNNQDEIACAASDGRLTASNASTNVSQNSSHVASV